MGQRTIKVVPPEDGEKTRAQKVAELVEKIEEERERRKRPKRRRIEETAHAKVVRLTGNEPDTDQEWLSAGYKLYKKNLLTKKQARLLGCRIK